MENTINQDLIIVKGVRGRLNDNGDPELNLEDVVRGLGFTQRQNKNGKIYESIRWERIAGYLAEFDFPPLVGEKEISQEVAKDGFPEFIPEPIFYLLAMKADNETAKVFQRIVAYEILPSIRRHGIYATDQVIDSIISNPDYGIRLLTELKNEREARKLLEIKDAQSQQIIMELKPKAGYYDLVLQNKGTVPIKQISADYGMTAQEMNRTLHDLGVQYRLRNTWLLYKEYSDKGYTQSKTHVVNKDVSTMHTYWTQKGRLFIYDLLKNKLGILPMIEREHDQAS